MGWATDNEFAAPLGDQDDFVLTADAARLRVSFRAIGNLGQLVAENPAEDVCVMFQSDFRLVAQSDDHEEGGITYRFETWRRPASQPTTRPD